MRAHHLWPVVALLAHAGAHALSCGADEGDPCLLELSTVTIVFSQGIYSFDGDSQLIGSDGYVNGYTAGSGQFPELTSLDTDGGLRAGFSLAPAMVGQVGGSGIEGSHEAFAYFTFSGLQFVAKPGYRIDGVELSASGSRATAGDGYVALLVPGVPIFDGDRFSGSAVLDPFSAQSFSAGFSANAYYEEGDDGTAAAYGTARASIDAASVVVHLSAVPEPASVALWLLGGMFAMRLGAARAVTPARRSRSG
jgi:hypothetical protein